MGFDILFRPTGKGASAREFRRYFEQRPHYRVDREAADYSSEDTGGHFQFFLGEFRKDRPRCELGPPWASFHINYMRPYWFALEALPELEDFARHFDTEVELWDAFRDQQGPFDADVFVTEWAERNWMTLRWQVMKDAEEYQPAGLGGGISCTYPAQTLMSIWRWNHRLADTQDEWNERDVYVPPIGFFEYGGAVVSAINWADAIRALVPRVDYVFLGRNRLREPARQHDETDWSILPWSEVEKVIGRFAQEGDALRVHPLQYEEAPGEIIAMFERAPPLDFAVIQALDPSTVLEHEIIDEMKRLQATGEDADGSWRNMREIVRADLRN